MVRTLRTSPSGRPLSGRTLHQENDAAGTAGNNTRPVWCAGLHGETFDQPPLRVSTGRTDNFDIASATVGRFSLHSIARGRRPVRLQLPAGFSRLRPTFRATGDRYQRQHKGCVLIGSIGTAPLKIGSAHHAASCRGVVQKPCQRPGTRLVRKHYHRGITVDK